MSELDRPLSPGFVRGAWDNEDTDKGRADGCANTNIGPGRSSKESDVNTSLPPAADLSQQPPEIAWMGRADGCPSCVINTVLPNITRPQEHGFVAHYTCEDCGHDWITSWSE